MPIYQPASALLPVAALSDPGVKRTINEDFVAYRLPRDSGEWERHGALFVICDGVGGGPAGEQASKSAAQAILRSYYQGAEETEPRLRLSAAIEQANRELYAVNQASAHGADGARPMATTVVAAVLKGSRLIVVHAGDSRAYLVRAGQAMRLTEDHSWVADMVRAGDLTEAQAAGHPWRNRISRTLGPRQVAGPETREEVIRPGDVLVLCSDGLTRAVKDAELAAVVWSLPPVEAARRLVRLANERGGGDNISVIVSAVLPPPVRSQAAGHRAPSALQPVNARRRRLLLVLLLGAVLLALAASVPHLLSGPDGLFWLR